MTRFTLRRTAHSDADGLNALYRKHVGLDRTREQFLWEWFEGPGGPAPSWVIVDSETGQIAAHHGVIPVPMWHGDRPVKGARTENSMVDPDYGRRVPYVAYEAKILEELKTQCDVIFTVAGGGAPGQVRRRLGYSLLGRWQVWTAAATPSWYLGRFGHPKLTALAPVLPYLKRPPANWTLEPADDPYRVAALWDKVKREYSLAPARPAELLDWRIFHHGHTDFICRMAMKDGKDAGFVAWSERAEPFGTIEVRIEDIFVIDNTPAAYQSVLQHVFAHYHRRPARVIVRTLETDSPLRTALAQMAPFRSRGGGLDSEVLAYFSDPDLADAAWQITLLIGEGR